MSLPTEKEELRKYLVENYSTEEVGGILYVTPSGTCEPQVVEYRVSDTTPYPIKFKQNVARNYVHRNIRSVQVYGAQALLRKVCTMYKDPVIDFDLKPVKTRNVTFHLISWKMTGDIVSNMYNKSVEGQEGDTVTWRWRACPTDPNAYSWENVAGSADLTPNWSHNFTEDSTVTYLSRVSQSLSKISPGSSVDASASWSTGGLGSVIFTLLQIFLTGTVTLRNGYDVTVNYTWKSQTQSVSRHIDTKVILPVEGNVGVAWD
jgi:hypothetical protein